MRNKTSLFKRSLAGLLTLVLVLGMIPAMSWVAKAAEGDDETTAQQTGPQGDFITMPITIRDFAADGMLFEYNETSKTAEQTVVESTPTIPVYNNVKIADNGYALGYAYVLRWIDYHDDVDPDVNPGWHIIFVNSDGSIDRVYPKGTFDDRSDIDTEIPDYGMVIYAYGGDGANIKPCNNYDYFAGITESTKGDYSFEVALVSDSSLDTGYYVKSTKSKTYIPNNTKGFGMLYTNETDIHDKINEWEDVGALLNSEVAWNDFTIAEEANNKISGGLYDGFYYGEYEKELNTGTKTFTHYSPYKYVDLWEVDEAGNKTNYGNQMLVGGTIRTNLMQKELKDGKPVYTQDAVKWIAEYLQLAMKTPERNADGTYNTAYVTGDKVAGGDTLANRIRNQVNENFNDATDDEEKLGNYEDSYNKFYGVKDEDGTWKIEPGLRTYEDIKTWYDAAFFLMHNTWRDSSTTDNGTDGYGKPVPEYHSMHLVAKQQADGSVTYVFNSMFNDTVYDPDIGEIYNTQITNWTQATNSDGTGAVADGNIQPVDRFDPLGKHGTDEYLGYGIPSPDTYGDMIEPSTDRWNEYYDDTNYHLSLEGHAEFVYRYSSNLYFTFTGDDDVYLYINGVRVLDIGGGHSIAKVSINVNDVAQKIGLQEGGTYSFDFFYMERHGTAANFGIETNIQLAEAGMITTKNGYQNGTTTGYDAPVDPSQAVSYSFTLTNSGDATLTNLIFEDAKLDVRLGYDGVSWGKKIEGVDAEGKLVDGGPLKKMYVYKTDANGDTIQSWTGATLTDTKLREILAAGIGQGESITIYNIRYKIADIDWVKDGTIDRFTNVVNTTATDKTNNKELHGTADWKVQKATVVVDPFHVYNSVRIPQGQDTWQPNNVNLTREDLLAPAVKAGLTVTDSTTIELCNASGNTNKELWSDAYQKVVENIQGDITDDSFNYNSKAPGMQTVYYKVKGAGHEYLVYHFDVITYGTVDNVYVLDYGLNVELNCDQYGFRLNDHLSVPQNIHEVGMTKTMDVYQQEKKWGNFVESGTGLGFTESVEYQPFDIIDGCDSMTVTFHFDEEGVTEETRTKFNSVEMQQTVSTAPANVVYYEEDFKGITYVSEGENQWIHYETMAPVMEEAKDANGDIIWEQAKDENGNLVFEPAFDADGHPVYVQAKDENGNLLVDENNNPVYEQAKDEDGKLLEDENGNPVYVQAQVPVMVPVMVQKVENGKPVYEFTAGTNQSADQDSNYGSDPNYEEDKVGHWNGEVIGTTRMEVTEEMTADETQDTIIGNLNNSLGITGPGQASNGTVNALEIKKTADLMYFDFKGTGFEIVSRTTANKYAIIMVFVDKVTERDENGEPVQGKWTTVRTLPVICESKGGDLYQVPVVSITGLEHGDYRVTVRGAAVAGAETKILYIDGIRIYGPLGEEAQSYYNPEEYRATFYEIKSLISDKDESTGLRTATYADVKMNDQGQIMYTDGTTVIEYTGNGYFMVEAADNVAEYISLGPNNEIYLSGQTTCSVIMVDLTPIEGYPEAARTIEVGAHRKVDSVWDSNGYAVLVYGSTPDAIYRQEFDATSLKENEYLVLSGTEQYYTIDVDNLDLKDGKYFLMIGTNGCQGSEVLALTSLKIAGYTLSLPTGMPDNEKTPDTDEITEGQMFKALKGIYDLMKASAEEEVDTTPVNENLVISVADIMSSNVNYGKTASVSIVATAEADNVKVFAPDGTEVALSKLTRKVSGDTVSFLVQWKVTGDRGNGQIYTIRVYDENGNVSANTKTVTLNIR